MTIRTTKPIKVTDNAVKESVAKCSPEDKFNFNEGARFAVERLGEKSPKPVYMYDVEIKMNPIKFSTGYISYSPEAILIKLPYLQNIYDDTKDINKYGVIGGETLVTDIDGIKLKFGDIVDLWFKNKFASQNYVVTKDLLKLTKSCYEFRKVKDHSEIKHGEIINDFKYIKE